MVDFDLFPELTKVQLVTVALVVCGLIYLVAKLNDTIRLVGVFCWACFIVPFFEKHQRPTTVNAGDNSNQNSLELFYLGQAHIYDQTRKVLLQGREECLRLAMAHLPKKDLVWIDIGGGTGANIETMDLISKLATTFKAVYLVDLSTLLCNVARERFAHHGWTNVHVIEADACSFYIQEAEADLITYSYSLSMIPTFNSTIDFATGLLLELGIVAAVDFGIQSSDTAVGRANTIGGCVNRNYPWLLRNFWRIWFEADRVFLDLARRNYLEYKFGTIKSLNCYNKRLGGIPYYIWIGCNKEKLEQLLHRINCLATELPYLAPLDSPVVSPTHIPVSKGHDAALSNLKKLLPYPSMYYQREAWRVYYDEANPLAKQFNNTYIYAFTWEDPREDDNILRFSSDDTVLAITSAGDNILHYALLPNPPKRIHAVDLNPAQNHLLELKLAALRALSYEQVFALFGDGKIANFKDLLIDKLAVHLSSQAFQFWMDKAWTFEPKSRGLYDTGFSKWGIRLGRWVFALTGVLGYAKQICEALSMKEQVLLWNNHIKKLLFNPIVARLLVGNPIFLWRALGVPTNQAKMMGNSVIKYVIDTLDPVLKRSLISTDNYFYYVCLMGKFAYNNCPQYLSLKGFKRLNAGGPTTPLSNIRIHTDTLNEVFNRLSDKAITIAIIMDHMDWFDPKGRDAHDEISALKKCLAPGGRVMLRSASQKPWYLETFKQLGFETHPAAVRHSGELIDRINMYASTWVCTKKMEDGELPARRRMLSLALDASG